MTKSESLELVRRASRLYWRYRLATPLDADLASVLAIHRHRRAKWAFDAGATEREIRAVYDETEAEARASREAA